MSDMTHNKLVHVEMRIKEIANDLQELKLPSYGRVTVGEAYRQSVVDSLNASLFDLHLLCNHLKEHKHE